MTRQFILVVYDISNDRRRSRLHDVLLDYGTPVQYSVFECLLESDELDKMKKAVKRLIRPRRDNVRYYYLCADCLDKVEITCGVGVLREHPEALVV
jgi:CRISPR-associated protein Cas2